MGKNQAFETEFRVRLPSSLAERIAATAKKELRSRNSQYVYMLEDWFKMKDGLERTEGNLEVLSVKITNAETEKDRN